MVPVAEIGALLRDGLTAWRDIRLADVLFGHRDTTILALIVLVGLAAASPCSASHSAAARDARRSACRR